MLTMTKVAEGNYVVEGDLTFTAINKKSVKLFESSKSETKICINLEKVKSADSAGLALVIEWIKYSNLCGNNLTFSHVPQQLLALANLYGFEMKQYLSN